MNEPIQTTEDQQFERLVALAQKEPGKKIKALLTLKNISQAQLAEKYNVAASEISKVISGKRRTPYVRKMLAEELGVEEEALFGPKIRRKQPATNRILSEENFLESL